jgi:PAS domain S-box-containing protein
MCKTQSIFPASAAIALTIILAALLLWPSPAASGAETVKKVLVFYTEGKSVPAVIILDQSILQALRSGSSDRIDYYSEYLDLARFPDADYRQDLRDFYRRKYANREFDLIIAIGVFGLSDLLKDVEELFPGTPVVFSTLERRAIEESRMGPNVTGIIWKVDLRKTLDIALGLHPDTRRVVVIAGAAAVDQYFIAQARQEFHEYEGRADFTYLSGLPMKELLAAVSRLPEQTIIFFLSMNRDGSGELITSPLALSQISPAANRPIYGAADTYFGYGIVGGHLASFELIGQKAAEIGLRILRGERPADIPILDAGMTLDLFDWRQLQRWGISEKRLPPGSIVRFKELSVWEKYKWYIAGTLALCIIQSLLIYVLLRLQRRLRKARQSAEERHHFEALLAELSAAFVYLPASEVDQAIEQWLVRLREFLGVDQILISEFSQDQAQYYITHSTATAGIAPFPKSIDRNAFSWYTQQILSEVNVVLSRIPDDLPAEASAERQYGLETGLKSSLSIPLSIRGSSIGVLVLCSFGSYRSWPKELVSRLQLVGESFANAIARKRAEAALRKSEDRYRDIVESSLDLICTHDLQGRILSANPAATRALGYDPNEYVGKKSIRDILAPEFRNQFDNYLATIRREGVASGLMLVQTSAGEQRIWEYNNTLRTEGVADPIVRGIARDVTERKRAEEALHAALAEVSELKNQLQAENVYLQEEIRLTHNFDEIIGNSDALKYVLYKVEQVAAADTIVLILGETGTGKELVARAIHQSSPRRDRPLVKVNCAALPANLIESELFGHERGAFTGAQARKIGRFELANGGTLFLDEIGELPLELQSKLLRILQDGEFERVGGSKTIKVDVRILAATNRNLQLEVQKGLFREDLWYRLNVFPITLPPLRNRKDDIPLLVNFFINLFNREMGRSVKSVEPATMKALGNYSWPGNVRELSNVIERAVINTRGSVLHLAEKLETSRENGALSTDTKSLEEIEREIILQRLDEAGWKISGPEGAAKSLGLNPSTLRTRMIKLGIQKFKNHS